MWDTQRACWFSDNYIKAFLAGYGSGKSTLLCKRIIASALHNAPVPVMLVSPSYRQAKRTVIPTLLSLLHGRKIKYKYNRSDAMFELFYHGRTAHIWVGSGDVPDSLKGANLAAVYADEAFMLDYTVIEICLSRIRDPRARLRELFLCGTPEDGVAGWAYDVLEGDRKKDFDIGLYQASTLENKALPKEFIESLMSAYDEKTREAYIHGKLVNMSSGVIYGSFDKARHVRSVKLPRDVEVFAGVDFNFDPACATLFYVTGDGVMNIFDEVHLTGGHDTYDLVDEVWKAARGQLTTFFPDPSGTQRKSVARVGTTDITILQQAGIRLRKPPEPFSIRARRRTPPRRDRYNATNGMFREDKIVIDPRCKHLIKSFTMGTYEGFTRHDGHDHQCFSGDTLVETLHQGVVRMRDMSRTGFVRDSGGAWAAYFNGGVVRKPAARMVYMYLSNGKRITATPDHLFMTADGRWVQAKDMAGEICREVMSSSITGLGTPCGAARHISWVNIKDSMSLCGNTQITGNYHAVTRYITSTLTRLIIARITWLRSLRRSTGRFMLRGARKPELSAGLPHSKRHKRSRNYGTPPKQGARGIGRISLISAISCSLKRKRSARIVGVSMRLLRTAATVICSVARGAVRHTAGTLAWITRPEHAACVVQTTQLTSTANKNTAVSVVLIEAAPDEDAYCPTVPVDGCFSLRGIVVSNSDSATYFCELENPITNKVQRLRQWY